MHIPEVSLSTASEDNKGVTASTGGDTGMRCLSWQYTQNTRHRISCWVVVVVYVW